MFNKDYEKNIHEAQNEKTIIQIKQKELLFLYTDKCHEKKDKTLKGYKTASGFLSQYKQYSITSRKLGELLLFNASDGHIY